MRLVWCVCDYKRDENPCLYSEQSIRRLKSDPPRCIKHGNILDYAPSLEGMTREQIRRKWKAGEAL
jgi:hypothetical protein